MRKGLTDNACVLTEQDRVAEIELDAGGAN